MAGTAFTQKPHGHQCQLPLAAVPGTGRLCPVELPGITITQGSNSDVVEALVKTGQFHQVNRENQNQTDNAAHNRRKICGTAGQRYYCGSAAGWYGPSGSALSKRSVSRDVRQP